MRTPTLVFAAVLCCAAFPPRTAAAEVTLKLNLHQVDAPNLGGFANLEGVPAWGGGAEVSLRAKDSPWSAFAAGGISTGGHDFSDPLGNTEKTRLSGWYIRGGADYHAAVGALDVYGGPSLFWSTSTLRFEHAGEEPERLEPATWFGVENRAGAALPLANRFGIYGEFSMLFGRARFADDEHGVGTIQGWFGSSAFRGGLAITL
jgi:hypothetical protein